MLEFAVYTARDYRRVSRLVNLSQYTHRHLEWRPPRIWLRDPQQLTWLAYYENEFYGVLAITIPHEQTCWLRLLVIDSSSPAMYAERFLNYLLTYCQEQSIRQLAVLDVSDYWLQQALTMTGFVNMMDIVHLRREPGIIPRADALELQLRKVRRRDLPAILLIDHAAFGPLWRMHRGDIYESLNYKNFFVMAVHEEQPLAYLLATVYQDGVHLVRLATLPGWQGKGIARWLVTALITRYPEHSLTVNTQMSNRASLRVYENLGFELEPLRTPVWHVEL